MTGASDSEAFFARHLSHVPALVIIRGAGVEATVRLARRAWRLGIACVEVPLQSDDDLEALAATVAAGAADGHPVGAGTITSPALVRRVADAGAVFTVAPGLDLEVAEASLALGLPHLPGVATPSDVQRALRLHLTWQKAFPASVLTPGWISAMRAPFPQARFVATGGIDADNGPAFLRAGAAALSLGSSFADATDEAIRELLQPPVRD